MAALAACIGAAPALADSAPASCDKVASPEGSDSAFGSVTAPLRTAQKLIQVLTPGQVGCLRAGTYSGGLRFGHGGTAGAPLTLRSYPGEQATIVGRVYVPQGSSYVTVADLGLNGSHQPASEDLPSPTVDGSHATFEADDVTDEHTEICFAIGSAGWGIPDSTRILDSHIHDCGLLPSRNGDHGIYIVDATNTVIAGNLIDHNTDRGIQLYPASTGAVITANVISENGEGIDISGEGGVASSDSVIEHNLIVNANIRSDVESWYPAGNPRGTGNVVQFNCVSRRGINGAAGGFSASNNATASASELVGTPAGGYAPVAGSACAGMVPEVLAGQWGEGGAAGGAPPPVEKPEGGPGPTGGPGSPATTTPGGAPEQPGGGGSGASGETKRGEGRSGERGPATGPRRHHHRHAARHRSRRSLAKRHAASPHTRHGRRTRVARHHR